MADNFLQQGDVVEVAAGADVLVNAGHQVGKLFGVAMGSALSGVKVRLKRTGVFVLPKLTTDVVTVGAVLYWDDGNSHVTLVASTHKRIGFAHSAAGNGVLIVEVLLTGEASDS
jgi:predicted RecA/RadA family phage recombinase